MVVYYKRCSRFIIDQTSSWTSRYSDDELPEGVDAFAPPFEEFSVSTHFGRAIKIKGDFTGTYAKGNFVRHVDTSAESGRGFFAPKKTDRLHSIELRESYKSMPSGLLYTVKPQSAMDLDMPVVLDKQKSLVEPFSQEWRDVIFELSSMTERAVG